MIDKESIINHAKGSVKKTGKNQRWDSAFNLAIGDLSARLLGDDRMGMKTVNVAISTREITLEGAECDIDKIYYLMYGTGDNQVWVEYTARDVFLKDYNNSSASAGIPARYTFIGLESGLPRIRFDKPTESATTMEVWYYKDFDESFIRNTKGPALVALTLGWFHGPNTVEGMSAFKVGWNLVKQVRANARRVVDNEAGFKQSRADRGIASVRKNMRDRR